MIYRIYLKRISDILIAVLLLVFLVPVWLTVMLILTIINRGSPFFKQARPGKHGKMFYIVKFKSMNSRRDVKGELLPDNMRLTPVGRFIRNTSIDELPQLLNVLKGDMSLVGPRPCLLSQKRLVKERKIRKVFKVKPGITGLAQISGINMRTPTLLSKTDLKMIKKMSLSNYFYYIFRTILQIIN